MINLSKYQQTAKRIIEVLKSDEFELNMQLYNNRCDGNMPEHACGTTFCLAGWLAFKDNYPSEYIELYDDGDEVFCHISYSKMLIGECRSTDSWVFLFGSEWSNDKEKAIKRAEYVLEHGIYPSEELWSEYE